MKNIQNIWHNGNFHRDQEDLFCKFECGHIDELPLTANASRKVYGYVFSAEDIVERLFENFLEAKDDSLEPGWTKAEHVLEYAMESVYNMCDEDVDYRGEADTEVNLLQSAIDWWLFWNVGLFRMFSECRWFNPEKHSIGLCVIDFALEKFTRKFNEHYWAYSESNRTLTLDWSDWSVERA